MQFPIVSIAMLAGLFSAVAQATPIADEKALKPFETVYAPAGPEVPQANGTIIETDSKVAARQSYGNILICDNTWFNTCVTYGSQPFGTCYTLGSFWNDKMTSVRAGTGNICYIWEHSNCGGLRGGPIYANNDHYDLGIHGWNNRATSYMCHSQ
ncbi:hypothetical protein QBC44DRAFT_367992 [Cladorrhinum sp. PSN332]|nr:hypothetical protein QBC44DRAFT_367992 [Cladorrhinum sp. PSN332]